MTLPKFRNILLLWIISLYLILNYGMMVVRIPPTGNGLPIGELMIIFLMVSIHFPSTTPCLNTVFPISLALAWWIYILLNASLGVPKYGLWALRDATNVIESLFILGGFAFAQRPENIELLFRWLKKLLIIACIYGLTYPLENYFQNISPKVSGGSGQLVSLIGMYTNSSVMMLWASFFIMAFSPEKKHNTRTYYAISVLLIGFTLVMFQARTIYLQIIAIFIFFSLFRKDLINKGIMAIIICLIIVSLFPILDIKFSGRLGETVSIDFFIKHFLAIFGIASSGVEQAAGGVSLRTNWWTSIFSHLFSSWSNFLFGLGYGFPLIDFHVTGGIAVREPHNSYISFIARSGIIGLGFFIWVHSYLLQVWNSAYKKCKIISWNQGANMLLVLMIYFILIWVFALGEDAFEKPFNTIPYYFFWGIVLRFAYHLKHGNIGPEASSHQNSIRP